MHLPQPFFDNADDNLQSVSLVATLATICGAVLLKYGAQPDIDLGVSVTFAANILVVILAIYSMIDAASKFSDLYRNILPSLTVVSPPDANRDTTKLVDSEDSKVPSAAMQSVYVSTATTELKNHPRLLAEIEPMFRCVYH